MVLGEAVFSYCQFFWFCQPYVSHSLVDLMKWCDPIISTRLTASTLNPVILASLLFHQVWGWEREDILKCRIFPIILRCVITQMSYIISFIMAKASEHTNKLVLQLLASLNKIRQYFGIMEMNNMVLGEAVFSYHRFSVCANRMCLTPWLILWSDAIQSYPLASLHQHSTH